MHMNINFGIISINNIDLSIIINKARNLFKKNKSSSFTMEYINKLRSIKRDTIKRRTIYNFDAE